MDAGTLSFDPDELTIQDMEDFEEASGVPFEDAMTERVVIDPVTKRPVLDARGRPEKAVQMPVKVLKALVWIIRRSEDPSFTLEAAGKMKIRELALLTPAEADADAEGKD